MNHSNPHVWRAWLWTAFFATALAHSQPEPSQYEIQQQLAKEAAVLPDTFKRAKNIILFLGDGMGVSTVTAARILDGQRKGGAGEENNLFFDGFEYTALSKTYSINQQTPDSASTMTAIMTGHKTKAYVVGFDANVVVDDHRSITQFGGESKPIETLVERFEKMGKATGIVTTTRLTHATPACCYAHSPSRWWEDHYYQESDETYKDALEGGFKDIALQLIEFPYGNGIDVALGGGRRGFLPAPPKEDPKADGAWGRRMDSRDLIQEWLKQDTAAYVDSREKLLGLDTDKPMRLLGLFSDSDMKYESDIESEENRNQPRLSEMATTALEILKKNEEGFFLMVEGGRIDHAHHMGNARRALIETIELDRAIRAVYSAMSEKERDETLMIVTADHSHTLTIAGYPTRGNPILGKVYGNKDNGEPVGAPAKDGLELPYTTLSYANGPGNTSLILDTKTYGIKPGGISHKSMSEMQSDRFKYLATPTQPRPDLHEIDTEDADFIQEGLVPMKSETHGGEDVAIYAKGPGSHLFRGTREQNYIFHAILQAMGNP